MSALSKEKKDAAIIATNNSSIVCKRSVERLYSLDNDHQFLRYFVPKPQRRSPLVNRSYWVRMQAVDFVVRSFLEEKLPAGTRKVVVNLGCGYDPLPFQCLSRKLGQGDSVFYVDIDYPDLMNIKASVVSKQREINELLTDVKYYEKAEGNVHFESAEYLALGCDLRDLDKLRTIFAQHGILDAAILFTAEVSLTYMDRDGVDNLVKWAAELPNARFSILEHFLPDGPEHPFSRTMLKQYNALNSALKSAESYPTLHDQVNRYSSRGWKHVTACDMLAFWSGITESERQSVETVEPFDEWEEFYLFCQHYFILYATNQQDNPGELSRLSKDWTSGHYCKFPKGRSRAEAPSTAASMDMKYAATFTRNRNMARRCGAAATLSSESIVYQGGQGTKDRLSSSLLITSGSAVEGVKKSSQQPSARVYHTMTAVSPGKILLVGGRTSPDKPMKDAYLLENDTWRRVEDLPEGRSRHQAVALGDGRVLVCGGRGAGNTVLGDWIMWTEGQGWSKVSLSASARMARFSAGFCWLPRQRLGFLIGGMDSKGNVLDDIVIVEELYDGTFIANMVDRGPQWRRMGCVLRSLPSGDVVVVGGVSGGALLPQAEEVALLKQTSQPSLERIAVEIPRDKAPLLIGHSVEMVNGRMVIGGGGGVCFPMGGCFSEGVWELHRQSEDPTILRFIEEGVATASTSPQDPVEASNSSVSINTSHPIPQPISKVTIETAEDFHRIISANKPVLITNLPLGPCTTLWDSTYLTSKIGDDRPVSVHVANTTSMSFHHKNFSYKTMPFSTFLTAATSGSQNLYFRSLNTTSPSAAPTNLSTDFPILSADFQLPPQLSIVTENMHSSPLRISSADVGMWLHYDAMANVLCHIRGQKKLRLYPPSDVTKLSFPAGASTSTILDVFETPSPVGTSPIDVEMKEGDVLFLPPLWLHAAKPVTACVAVNVFFRAEGLGMGKEVYPEGRDVYANRDLKAYERGREKVRGIRKEFEGLPEEVRRFYLLRLAEELKEGC